MERRSGQTLGLASLIPIDLLNIAALCLDSRHYARHVAEGCVVRGGRIGVRMWERPVNEEVYRLLARVGYPVTLGHLLQSGTVCWVFIEDLLQKLPGLSVLHKIKIDWSVNDHISQTNRIPRILTRIPAREQVVDGDPEGPDVGHLAGLLLGGRGGAW